MNYTTALFLVSDKVRMIEVCFSDRHTKTYRFKTFDHTIKRGDFVVVPHSGLTVGYVEEGVLLYDDIEDMHLSDEFSDNSGSYGGVCRVVRTDIEPNHDDDINYKWLIGKIDVQPIFDTLRMEAGVISRIRDANKRAARRKLRENLDISEDDMSDIQKLLPNGEQDDKE